uniref:Protein TRIGALACTOSYLDIACYLGLYCEROL 4, chloroplastic n=1 Tax=Oryza meridionalis TaxID=40149 RepID=A0A0E0C004_9ORYZ
MLRRMRWMADGDGRWELDVETPAAMEGAARPVPGDPLPLGLSRGPRVTRTKQLDFLHRFMASPLVPSFSASGAGLSVHHAHLVHLAHNWSFTILEQLHVQKLVAVVKEKLSNRQDVSWSNDIKRHLHDVMCRHRTLDYTRYHIATGAVQSEEGGSGQSNISTQGKLSGYFLCYLLPHQNITLEASWPGLFIDKKGVYWDVPLSLSADLASVGSKSGLSYHVLLQQNSGEPKCFGGGEETSDVPVALLPGLCAKAAVSIKKSIDVWRKKEDKLKNVQPYDLFLSEPHVSFTGIIGAVASGSFGDCSKRMSMQNEIQKSNAFKYFDERNKFAAFADLFASVNFTAQHGNFQRLLLDLTRVSARLDISSGSLFLRGASQLAQDFFFSRRPDLETFCDVCPDVIVSLQQQIVGPFSFRVESAVTIDPKKQDHYVRVDDSVFAIDWALKVLGSAKATAWYSPKHQEAMVELRFFET